jgi:hypothetical protein
LKITKRVIGAIRALALEANCTMFVIEDAAGHHTLHSVNEMMVAISRMVEDRRSGTLS